jgi:hypothetical protein
MADNDEPHAAAGGAGLGGNDLACDGDIFPRDSNATSDRQMIDPRLALLARASAKLILVEACVETLDHAFDDISRGFCMLDPCKCEREILDSFERYDCIRREQAFKDWRFSPAPRSSSKQTEARHEH